MHKRETWHPVLFVHDSLLRGVSEEAQYRPHVLKGTKSGRLPKKSRKVPKPPENRTRVGMSQALLMSLVSPAVNLGAMTAIASSMMPASAGPTGRFPIIGTPRPPRGPASRTTRTAAVFADLACLGVKAA